ncbi:ATP-dependent helicase [Psychromonas sp. MB-3u-54]|uniref:ATP-dependent DNA helicase n=1 Tax=Psychromonas sp. MB-3u-54 TaxID=2058319 RepID=UPI000C342BAE|nr:ATP-dependent DNA helicase [Psychromonas sp. MB-3u-54]PKH01528.1 ATP-dependent helicase [Psychromonas sp. MB-3u-54]
MISSFFSASGALSKQLPFFISRDAQIEMADAVTEAITKKQNLVVEAETGTGKTFAYLAPALLTFDKDASDKIIISTGSKALQEQLFLKDLPLLIAATNFTGSVTVLKGRSNYLCNERLARFMLETKQREKALQIELIKIKNWSLTSKTGDLAEIKDLAEDAVIIPSITSNNDNCLGRECPSFDDCFIVKARKKAMDADLVVINHHLFFADLAVKETGFGELIPEAGVYIFDEAHQLPDIASLYFGESLSSRQLMELAKEIEFVYRTELREAKQMSKAADQLRLSVLDFRMAFAIDKGTGSWRDKSKERVMQLHVDRVLQVMDFLKEVILERLGKSDVLDHCFERLTQFMLLFKKLNSVNESGFSYWFECTKQHFSLNITPLSVAGRFQAECEKKQASWIFTSATLSVKGKFDHFTALLGLQESQCLQLASPFDYAQQTLFVVPRLIPEPGTPGLADKLVEELAPVIRASKGRCFFLCTSHAMMNQLAAGFRQILTLPVLLQGEKSKQALLDEFINHGNALLVATSSFWEGVDVRGQGLSCVIIDKIPFSSPEEPLLKARIEDAQLKGKDPFAEVQLPQAVITFKQGVGRLIRAEKDKGVLIVCDTRLVTRKYGNLFLNSLPCMPRTRSLDNAIDFLKTID